MGLKKFYILRFKKITIIWVIINGYNRKKSIFLKPFIHKLKNRFSRFLFSRLKTKRVGIK